MGLDQRDCIVQPGADSAPSRRSSGVVIGADITPAMLVGARDRLKDPLFLSCGRGKSPAPQPLHGSLLTPRWREMDSNHRFRARGPTV